MTNVTKLRETTSATPEIENVPLFDLYLSDLNPRQDAAPEGIALLADSIRVLGLIQNLSGFRDAEGRVGIVAGGRRYRALQSLIESHPHLSGERPEIVAPPVRIAPDEETARAWAYAENTARTDLHPADEIQAYGKMAASGAPVATIASAFAKSEAHVYRRLALASLPGAVIEALRAGDISLGVAAAFTVSQDEALSLQTLDTVRGRDFSEHRVKQMLHPDAARSSDRRAAFVGIEAYEAAGGKITRDLFSEDVFLADPALLNDLFTAKLDETARRLTDEDGWKWAETETAPWVDYQRTEKLDRLYPQAGDPSEEEAARYDELAELAEAEALDAEGEAEFEALQAILDGGYEAEQKSHSGVIVYIDNQGYIRTTEGLVRSEERSAAIEAGVLRDRAAGRGSVEDAPKSPYSAKLAGDLNAAALGARQNAVLDHPDLILDLLAWQVSGGMGYRRAFELRADAPRNAPETETGFALDERLTKAGSSPKDPWGSDLVPGFRAFRKKGRAHRDAELIRHLTRLLDVSDDGLGKLIDKEAATDLRSVWTPTAENFLGRMKGTWLDALWIDLLDLAADHPTATTFVKLKKGEKAARLEALFADPATFGASEAQAAKIAAWLPDHFA